MAGIDQQIEQRKMQFRGNPQALQQRYGQSKQLLDLLALQQIANEQKQKAQAMQMQMQQNPATVAQQIEQEVLQGKKAEMAQALGGMQAMRAPKRGQTETARGVAGALAQKQREKQSRMQRMANSGVASQPARNMERMYDGGIVGFSAGSGVMGAGNRYQKDPIEEAIGAGVDAVANFLPNRRRKAYTEILRKLRKGEPITSGERRALRSYEQEFPEIKAEDVSIRKSDALAKEEGYDVEGLDLTGIELPEQRKPSAPTATTTAPATATAAPTDPGLMERKAQQEQELLAAGEDILGSPTIGPLKARRSVGVPDLLRAREEVPVAAPAELSMQEQLLQRLMESSQQEQKDITSAREALEAQYGGRSKGRRILDRLIAASQMQGGARTNQQALARLAGGYATAAGQEKKAREEGLAKIAERQRALTQGQLGVATGLAQIERGEALTKQGARGLELEAERLGLSTRQIEDANRQFYDRLGLDYAKMGIDSQKAGRIAEIQEESNRITEEFNQARTKGAKDKLAADYAQMMVALRTETREAVADAIDDLKLSGLSESEQAAEAKRIKDNAEKALAQQENTLRAMQKAATGIEMGSFTPTTGAAVSGSGIKVLGKKQ